MSRVHATFRRVQRKERLAAQKAKKEQFKRDKQGYLYSQEDGFAVRLTECCKAVASFSDDILCCKGCYKAVGMAFGMNPVL